MQYLTLSLINIVVIILLAVFVIWNIRKQRKAGYPREDERTAKIGGKAAKGAFWISYAFMLSLILWIIFGTEILNIHEYDEGYYIISIMFVSSISYGLLRWYYGRKGE